MSPRRRISSKFQAKSAASVWPMLVAGRKPLKTPKLKVDAIGKISPPIYACNATLRSPHLLDNSVAQRHTCICEQPSLTVTPSWYGMSISKVQVLSAIENRIDGFDLPHLYCNAIARRCGLQVSSVENLSIGRTPMLARRSSPSFSFRLESRDRR